MRLAQGFQQGAFAQAIGRNRTTVSHIEAGRYRTDATFWTIADEVLAADGELLAEYHQLAMLEAEMARSAAEARRDEARQQLAQLNRQPGLGPAHRDEAQSLASTLALRWLVATTPPDLARSTGSVRVGASDVTRLEQARTQLKAVDNALGGGAAVAGAQDYLTREVGPLLAGQYTDAVGRALHGAAAQLTLDLGWMVYPAGQHESARRHMLRALELTQTGNHRLLGGRVLSALAHQSLHLGRVREATDLAAAALAGTRHLAPPTAVAMFEAMHACALAGLGDRAGCEAALARADRALNRASTAAELPAWLDFDQGGLTGHAARAYRDLSAGKRARPLAEAALAQCHAGHSRTRAQRRAILASVLVQTGDLDGAAGIGRQVVAEAWQLHSGHVLVDVARLLKVIDPSRSAATFEFAREARQLLASRPAPGPSTSLGSN